MKELLIFLVCLVVRASSQAIVFVDRDIVRCASQKVPRGSCQVIDKCPRLGAELASLPVLQFLKDFGGCGKDSDGNVRVCCPLESVETDSPCSSSSVSIKGLGCVTAVPEAMTWAEAKDNCIKRGSRLLEGITTSSQLRQLRLHFGNNISFKGEYHDVWLGITQGRWFEGGLTSPPQHFWYPGQPSAGESDCGYVALQMETPTFWDTVCTAKLPSFCQSLRHGDSENVNPGPMPCLPPSKILKDLGCVTPQKEHLPWSEARDSCRLEGSRLLGGVNTTEQLQLLRDQFEDSFQFKSSFHDVWLGISDRSYTGHGGAAIPASLWDPSQPETEPNRCGYVALQLEPPRLWETSCTETRLPYFCHKG